MTDHRYINFNHKILITILWNGFLFYFWNIYTDIRSGRAYSVYFKKLSNFIGCTYTTCTEDSCLKYKYSLTQPLKISSHKHFIDLSMLGYYTLSK